jgi:hypothetical protein
LINQARKKAIKQAIMWSSLGDFSNLAKAAQELQEQAATSMKVSEKKVNKRTNEITN